MSKQDHNDINELIIIGGGIAGLYAAWRIAHEKSDYKIVVLEASNRLGGRIWSQTLPGLPFSAELGAMRFRDNHQLVGGLIKELKLATKKFDVADASYYLRGH